MYTPAKTPVRNDDDEQPRRRWRWLIALMLLFLIGGIVWAVRPNSHLARAQELQKVLFSPDAKNLSPDQRKAMFDEYRAEMKQLTDDQKAQLFEPMRQQQMAELDRYFAMSPQDKTRYLDDRIDRSEKSKPSSRRSRERRSARRLRRRSSGRGRQGRKPAVGGRHREAQEAGARPHLAGRPRQDGPVPPRHGQPAEAAGAAGDESVSLISFSCRLAGRPERSHRPAGKPAAV